MQTVHRAVLGLLFVVSSATASVLPPTCETVTFTLCVDFESLVWSKQPDPNDKDGILAFLDSRVDVSDKRGEVSKKEYEAEVTIQGTYCRPLVDHGDARSKVLQILVHSATYNRTIFQGLGYQDVYSYQLYAASMGYHTLALDRAGHGTGVELQRGLDDLTDPRSLDPLSDLQTGLHVEVLHGVIEAIKDKQQLGCGFDEIVMVGHSYGSVMVNALARAYPQDATVLVLTAYSLKRYIAPPLAADLRPAGDVWPAKYGGILPGFLSDQSESTRTEYMFSGQFDPTVAAVDYAGEGAVTIGELLTVSSGLGPVPSFAGRVLVVTGEKDALNCNPDKGACADLLEQTGGLFQGASEYKAYVIPDTGHTFMLHYSAQDTFKVIHEWLGGAAI